MLPKEGCLHVESQGVCEGKEEVCGAQAWLCLPHVLLLPPPPTARQRGQGTGASVTEESQSSSGVPPSDTRAPSTDTLG